MDLDMDWMRKIIPAVVVALAVRQTVSMAATDMPAALPARLFTTVAVALADSVIILRLLLLLQRRGLAAARRAGAAAVRVAIGTLGAPKLAVTAS